MRVGQGARDPIVSVIIPHRDTPELLEHCLASLAQDVGREFEVIVVDSSCLPLPGISQRPQVGLMFVPPTGPGPARNAGAATARGEYLAFIDADCRVAPGWLGSLIETFRARPEIDLLGGRIETRPADGCDCTPTCVFDVVFSFKQELTVRRRGCSATANLAVRASVFAHVGGFAGVDILEDWEWCERAAKLGFRIEYVDEMLVFHEPRPLPELKGRWRRQVHQEYHTHVASGGGRWSYGARIAKVIIATPAALVYLVFCSRCDLQDRLRALPIVWQVRATRVAAMARLALNPQRPRPGWNG